MDEKRQYEILRAAKKVDLREKFSLRDIANIKRSIGNLVKAPEMVSIGATSEEIIEFSKILLQEVFEEQMKTI